MCSLWCKRFFYRENSSAFYYVFAFFPICMSCLALHVIKAGFWQSYRWPTAVIIKGLHSWLWLTSLGNVITKVSLEVHREHLVKPVSLPRPFQRHSAHIPTESWGMRPDVQREWGEYVSNDKNEALIGSILPGAAVFSFVLLFFFFLAGGVLHLLFSFSFCLSENK